MRARTTVLPGEDPAAFQTRRDAWTAQLQPRDDFEQFLADRAAQVSWQLDRADRAQAARLASRARAADCEHATAEADEVMVLARRLFWDPRGPIALYPQFKPSIGDPMRVSWSQDIEDPDEPARLVNRLENSLLGCAWMLDRWGDLRDLIEDGHQWQSPDRFMAIRLLGKQPIEPIEDEQVKAVYLCCKAIDPEGPPAYQDLTTELDSAEIKRLNERIDGREVPEQMPTEAEAARAVLLDLVESRTERLELLLMRHRDRDAAASADRFGFDDTREGEQLRRYQLGHNRALMRILDTFWKYRRETERAASGESDQRSGAHRRGRTDGGSGEGHPPTEPQGMTEVIPPVSAGAAPRIDDPSRVMPADFPPVATVLPVEPAPDAAAPADPALAHRNATNEPKSPTEGPQHPIRTTALFLLALLVGLGLTAVFAAAVKASDTSPPPQEQGDAPRSQLLAPKAFQSIDRASLAATISGHPMSGRSIGSHRDLATGTLVVRSSQDDATRIRAHTHRSRPPNERDGPATA
jgi:hypothetical protein